MTEGVMVTSKNMTIKAVIVIENSHQCLLQWSTEMLFRSQPKCAQFVFNAKDGYDHCAVQTFKNKSQMSCAFSLKTGCVEHPS